MQITETQIARDKMRKGKSKESIYETGAGFTRDI